MKKKLFGSEHVNVIGHIGRFSYQKNHEFLIEFFDKIARKNSNARLSLVGDGELKQEIESVVKNKGLMEKLFLLDSKKIL